MTVVLQFVLQRRQFFQDGLALFSLLIAVARYDGSMEIVDGTCLKSPVVRQAGHLVVVRKPTKMIGQRSVAEMRANDVLSDVRYGAGDMSAW